MIAWVKKHWILLLVATGGAILLWYLYKNYSSGSSAASSCTPGDPTCDPAAAALAQLQSAQALQNSGGGAATPSNVTPLANVLTPGNAPNTTIATPGGAVLQPNASASGVPTYSSQTQQFATNTPAPSANPINTDALTSLANQVAGSTTPLNTATITALPGGSFGVSSPQSLALTKGVLQGNVDVTAVQQAYDQAFAASNPQDASFYAANQESPYLIMQAQIQQGGQAASLPGMPYAGGPQLPTVGQLLPNGVSAPSSGTAASTGVTAAQQAAIYASEGIPQTSGVATVPSPSTLNQVIAGGGIGPPQYGVPVPNPIPTAGITATPVGTMFGGRIPTYTPPPGTAPVTLKKPVLLHPAA